MLGWPRPAFRRLSVVVRPVCSTTGAAAVTSAVHGVRCVACLSYTFSFRITVFLKQGVVTNFEIFRMREKQVPVDVVEMKGQFRLIVGGCVGCAAQSCSRAGLPGAAPAGAPLCEPTGWPRACSLRVLSRCSARVAAVYPEVWGAP